MISFWLLIVPCVFCVCCLAVAVRVGVVAAVAGLVVVVVGAVVVFVVASVVGDAVVSNVVDGVCCVLCVVCQFVFGVWFVSVVV